MVCKAFLESSNFVQTIMKSLTANQQDLHFIYFLLKSGHPQEDGYLAKTLGVLCELSDEAVFESARYSQEHLRCG